MRLKSGYLDQAASLDEAMNILANSGARFRSDCSEMGRVVPQILEEAKARGFSPLL